jgi:ATP-dependent 26S proteasome regulatory subunit
MKYDNMSNKTISQKLIQYIEAGFPIIYLNTFEEDSVNRIIRSVAQGKRIIEWSSSYGYAEYSTDEQKYIVAPSRMELNTVFEQKIGDDNEFQNSIFIIRDAHTVLEDSVTVSYLKELAILISESVECTVILLSPIVNIPRELENFITILELDYLTEQDIRELICGFCKDYEINISDVLLEEMSMAFKGLTAFEIHNILNLAYGSNGELTKRDLKLIFEQKQQKIRKSGILEMIPVKEGLDDIGGLENLKIWLKKKASVIHNMNQAKAFGVDTPKGVLIAGVPGCGKSLNAKAAASLFEVPLLRMDMGRLMGKYVGESEGNMRRAIALADAISPCVLWVDELEKAFAGIGSGGGGSEVATRLFGNFLTWMQEKTSPTFVVATANDITKLPPELLRKGRFDEIFYVGLPNEQERKHIFEIHIKKRRPSDLGKIDISALAKRTNGYSGADIEGVVRDGIESAFDEGKGELSTQDIINAIDNTHSLSEIMKDSLDKMSKMYETHKFKNASR